MLTDKAKDTRPVKSSELRIGNILKDSDGKEYAVSGHCIYSLTVIENMDLSANNFMPIPLSEEWLLKFGFEKKTFEIMTLYYYTLPVLSHGHINYYPKEHGFNIDLGTTSGYQFGTTAIKHVHQLQNLYFALTGEELTLKN